MEARGVRPSRLVLAWFWCLTVACNGSPVRALSGQRFQPVTEVPMRHATRAGAPGLALLGAITIASAQNNPAQDVKGPRGDTSPAGAEPPSPPHAVQLPAGPLGATPQTMPSTLSPENAARDRLPIMAQPLQLTDAQKRTIREMIEANPAP